MWLNDEINIGYDYMHWMFCCVHPKLNSIQVSVHKCVYTYGFVYKYNNATGRVSDDIYLMNIKQQP